MNSVAMKKHLAVLSLMPTKQSPIKSASPKKKTPTKKTVPKKKTCPLGKQLNTRTNRCNKIKSKKTTTIIRKNISPKKVVSLKKTVTPKKDVSHKKTGSPKKQNNCITITKTNKADYYIETKYNICTGIITKSWKNKNDNTYHTRYSAPSKIVYDAYNQKYKLQEWYNTAEYGRPDLPTQKTASIKFLDNKTELFEVFDNSKLMFSEKKSVRYKKYPSILEEFYNLKQGHLKIDDMKRAFISSKKNGKFIPTTITPEMRVEMRRILRNLQNNRNYILETKQLFMKGRTPMKKPHKIKFKKTKNARFNANIILKRQWHGDGMVLLRYPLFMEFLKTHYDVCDTVMGKYGYYSVKKIDYKCSNEPEPQCWFIYRYYNKKEEIEKMLSKDIQSCKKRFFLLPFHLHNHANMIIIDKKLKVVEHFEPHGHQSYNATSEHKLKELFDNIGYKYLGTQKTCPRLSFQASTYNELNDIGYNDPGGYCEAWSMYYAYERVRNPDLTPEKLHKKLMKKIVTKVGEGRFRNFIRQFANFVLRLAEKRRCPEGETWSNVLQKCIDVDSN